MEHMPLVAAEVDTKDEYTAGNPICARGEIQESSVAPTISTVSSASMQLVTRELLQSSLEQLVSDINTKRKRDSILLEDFKKDLELHCNSAYSSLQAALYNLYEQNSKVINDKLEELMSVMETIAKQEEELEHFKSEIGSFLHDMQQ